MSPARPRPPEGALARLPGGLLLVLALLPGNAGPLAAQAPAAPQAPPAVPPRSAPAGQAAAPEVPNERVQAQIEQRRRWHQGIVGSGKATVEQKAEAWGELGNLYHAYELFGPAERAYQEAEKLAPRDFRWPYYLGHVYRTSSDAAKALASFSRAVEKKGDDVAARVRLGEVLFDQQRFDEARPHLERALALDPKCAAAHFTLGLIANSAGDRAGAARHFEAALAQQPEASAVRSPLGLAYRDLGRLDDAREQLRQAGKEDVALADPPMVKVYGLADGLVGFLRQGDEAMTRGDGEQALAAYRSAVAADPLYALPRTRLAAALLRQGQADRAREQLELALRLAPDDPDANGQMGYLLHEQGKSREAAERYRATLAARPDDFAARLNLGRALLESGQAAAAAEEYGRLAERLPDRPFGWLGKSSALLAAGRCADAKAALEGGLARLPSDGVLSQALARLLASCPGDGVRDGQRAYDLASSLYQARPGPEHAETVAMALAELGRWDEALEWQRRALQEAEASGKAALAAEVKGNLALFESRRPSRTPWPPPQWALLLGRG